MGSSADLLFRSVSPGYTARILLGCGNMRGGGRTHALRQDLAENVDLINCIIQNSYIRWLGSRGPPRERWAGRLPALYPKKNDFLLKRKTQ